MEILEKIEKLTPDQQLRVLQLVKQYVYKNNLALLATKLCGYEDITPYTHKKIINCLESPKRRKLIVMPRGSFKSSLCSVAWPIQNIIKNPNIRILLDSELYSNSKNFLREIKGHLTSEVFVNLYGKFENKSCWNEGEFIVNQRTQILKEATVTASGIGAEKTGQHYDLIIADDLNSPTNSATTEGRERVINHYRYMVSLLEPGGTLGLVGTRYAENDAIGYALQNEIENWNGSNTGLLTDAGTSAIR